jgi:hypothetical protein
MTCTCIYPPPEITAHAVNRGVSEPQPLKWADWEEALAEVQNAAEVTFFQRELAAGRQNNLRKRILRFRVNGKRRFSVSAHSQDAYVWQTGRFKNDVEFWQQALGTEAQVQPVKDGQCLRFYLETEDQFAKFPDALKNLESVEFANEDEGLEEEEPEK